MARAAEETETLAIIPIDKINEYGLTGDHIVPVATKTDRNELFKLNGEPRMIELTAWDDAFMLFEQFLKTRNIESKELTDSFRRFSQTCINSYAVPTER